MYEWQNFGNTYSITDVELNLKPGVYLFLGYSEKDEKLLKAVTDQGAEEARGAIQGMVSFHNINNNKVMVVFLVYIYIHIGRVAPSLFNLDLICILSLVSEWLSHY